MSTPTLSLHEVADLLGVHERTVKSWCYSGELKAFNASRSPNSGKPRLRVKPADLDAFIAARAVNQSPPPRRRARRKPAENIPQYV